MLNVSLKWHSAEQTLALEQAAQDQSDDGIRGGETEGVKIIETEKTEEFLAEPTKSLQLRARSEPDPQLQQVVEEKKAIVSILSDEYFPSDPDKNAWFTSKVSPMQRNSKGQPAKGWLPVVVDASNDDELAWDREGEEHSREPLRRSIRSVVIEPKERELGNHRSPARKSKKKKENPRRQLTKEDYFSRQPSPPRSITPPPGPTRRRTNQEQIPWDDFRSERERRVEEDRATTRSQFPIKRRGTWAGDLQPVPNNPLIDPPPFACFNCWQEGHCVKQGPRPVTRSYCRNCGRNGVDERTCPRCSQLYEAHQAELRERRSRDSSRAEHSRQRCPEDPRGRSRSNVRDNQDLRRERHFREQERREQVRREQERR
ncbi:vicilin Car i 2.0101-like [Nasonia vitripennis]|uniref:Uncharacterized protein n=1 Tax=Nasonia vitripennis TaxID=7425 RepID=A0A7M7PZ04_NASVI|nr:vicilin Car i 2.0101-like [Nasonia vitripennis]